MPSMGASTKAGVFESSIWIATPIVTPNSLPLIPHSLCPWSLVPGPEVASNVPQDSLTVQPIGYVRCEKQLKFETTHQPDAASSEVNYVDLLPGRQFDLALQDLEGFERIWLISWFDRNTNWRPRPLPPRGPAKRRGLFATRSPHRPNPVGLSCVRLLGIEGLTLRVGSLDLMDGTPILDIKPYISTIDSFPESSLGWVGEIEESLAKGPQFRVEISELARAQLERVRKPDEVDLTERAFRLLRQDPMPHRTRRILQLEDGRLRMACGPWRIFYRVEGESVLIESVAHKDDLSRS